MGKGTPVVCWSDCREGRAAEAVGLCCSVVLGHTVGSVGQSKNVYEYLPASKEYKRSAIGSLTLIVPPVVLAASCHAQVRQALNIGVGLHYCASRLLGRIR